MRPVLNTPGVLPSGPTSQLYMIRNLHSKLFLRVGKTIFAELDVTITAALKTVKDLQASVTSSLAGGFHQLHVCTGIVFLIHSIRVDEDFLVLGPASHFNLCFQAYCSARPLV